MPELWETCDPKSRARLGYLYEKEYGYYPDWDERSGKKVHRPSVTIDADIEEEQLEEIEKFMQEPPHSPRYMA